MADIVPLTGLTQSTVSRLTADLARHRYLRRTEDPDDARVRRLRPSTRAERIAPELRRLQQSVDARIERELAGPDAKTLRGMLDLIARHY